MTTFAPTCEEAKVNARLCWLALREGRIPPTEALANVGEWTEPIKLLVRAFRINPATILTVYSSVVEKFPGLAEVLDEHSPKPEQHGDVNETVETSPRAEHSETPQSEDELDRKPELPSYAQVKTVPMHDVCPLAETYVNFSAQASYKAFSGFHIFAFLILVSAVIAGRAYLEIRQKRFFTNLMILFCAKTSFYAKSFTMGLVKNVLQTCGMNHVLGPNRLTPAKLLSDMSGKRLPDEFINGQMTLEEEDRLKKSLAQAGQKTVIWDEAGLAFTGMFQPKSINADFIDIFLEGDACPSEYRNATISRGEERIKDFRLTIQGNLTPDNAKKFAHSGSAWWGTGLGARCSIVQAPPPRKGVHPHPTDENDFLPIPRELISELTALHQRLGIPKCSIDPKNDKKGEPTDKFIISREDLPQTQCAISPDARAAYYRYMDALEDLCFDLPQQDFVGNYARLPETAMRIAVIFAVLNGSNHISLQIWSKAQELAEILRGYLHDFYAQVNGADEGIDIDEMIKNKLVQDKKAMTANQIRKSSRHFKKFPPDHFEKILANLVRNGEIARSAQAGVYRYTAVEASKK